MADFTRIGFGQVEPNHLSAQRTGQIYAQLPAAKDLAILENGQFVKYNYADGVCDFAGEGEWMMVFNEVKLYDEWRETYKDFALKASNHVEGQMVPRVFKINVGDIWTTNALGVANTAGDVPVECGAFEVGNVLTPNANGFLAAEGAADADFQVQVVKVYTLADGQVAAKVMRIK